MKGLEYLKIKMIQELAMDGEGNHSARLNQTVELNRQAVQDGFLKKFSGNMLSVYLFILTHITQDFTLATTADEIADYVSHSAIEIETALNMLNSYGFINLEAQGDEEFHISLTDQSTDNQEIDKVDAKVNEKDEQPEDTTKEKPVESTFTPSALNEKDIKVIEDILKQKAISENELITALSRMIPIQNIDSNFREEVDYWFNTFDKQVVKELIRRTFRALKRDPDLNCKAYMSSIAKEWIEKEIFSPDDLGASDKRYRETKELIEEFGIANRNQITKTHKETIHQWVNTASDDGFSLSIEVARFAIREAIRRKSDGRPSLNYIEKNFIAPFKDNKIKNIDEARKFLNKKSKKKKQSKNNKNSGQKNGKDFKWQRKVDFTRFRKN